MDAVFRKRIGFDGDLEELSKKVCNAFGLGEFASCKLVPIGYEDFNFALQASSGKFFVKIFSNERTLADCKRIVGVMQAALEAGVATPALIKSDSGFLQLFGKGKSALRVCVTEFIEGADFFSSGKRIGEADIIELARQVALVNSLGLKPKPIYDSWAIVNFAREFAEKGGRLDAGDLQLVKPRLDEFKRRDLAVLPHCLVHGDLIRTNVIKDAAGKLWLIDFSVANYYPRIQEIAVLAVDVLFDKNNAVTSERDLKLFLGEYQKKIRLTRAELETLPAYIGFAHAMHILRANYEKKANGNTSKENEYFLELGRAGLRRLKD